MALEITIKKNGLTDGTLHWQPGAEDMPIWKQHEAKLFRKVVVLSFCYEWNIPSLLFFSDFLRLILLKNLQ